MRGLLDRHAPLNTRPFTVKTRRSIA